MKRINEHEEIFADELKKLGYPFEREYKFHEEHKYRFDFAFPEYKLAFEIDGQLWGGKVKIFKNGKMRTIKTPGGHTSGQGANKDRKKDLLASELGWQVHRHPLF